MNKILTVSFVILLALLAACSKTEVVNLEEDAAGTTPETEAAEDNQTETTTAPAPAAATGEKVSVKCDDTDLNDPDTVGRARVTYSDGSTKDYYDQCKDIILVEYICEGKNVKTRNAICDQQCLSVKVADQESCPGCKVGFCA